MNWLNPYRAVIWIAISMVLSGCHTTKPAAESLVPAELTQPSYLYEVVRHLYRWHLDETEIEQMVSQKKFVCWLARLNPELDPGDHSAFAEILLPQLNMRVVVKKADYAVEEMGVDVKGSQYKITRITRGNVPDRKPSVYQVVQADMKQMREYLFRTRNQQDFPDEQMIERMRRALRQEMSREGLSLNQDALSEKVVHLAPLSPVANETWVFWEDGRKLFYFASDIDLGDPAVWEHETLMARIFDLDQQVVVSREEAPGSNRFLTRYQVSRVLFNCVVLGRRVAISPPNAADK